MADNYKIGTVVGGMKLTKKHMGKMTTKGLIPHYDCICTNCGRAHYMSQDSIRKRRTTGATKCASCVQVKPHGRRPRNGNQKLSWELNVPKELFDKFISQR